MGGANNLAKDRYIANKHHEETSRKCEIKITRVSSPRKAGTRLNDSLPKNRVGKRKIVTLHR